MHDLAGLAPECMRLAGCFARAGLRVYVPHLFGRPGRRSAALGFGQAALSRDFNLFAGAGPSSITQWLRPLCRELSGRDAWRPIGVVGMGVTGSLVFSLLAEPCVGAAVTSHPAVPFPLRDGSRAVLGVPEEHAANLRTRSDVHMLGWRFSRDLLCPPERFERLRQLMGRRFDGRDIPSGDGSEIPWHAHAVLTYRRPLTPPIPDAMERTIRFLAARLALAGAEPEPLSAPLPRAAAYRGP
jgi:dienelactone hydrolase